MLLALYKQININYKNYLIIECLSCVTIVLNIL